MHIHMMKLSPRTLSYPILSYPILAQIGINKRLREAQMVLSRKVAFIVSRPGINRIAIHLPSASFIALNPLRAGFASPRLLTPRNPTPPPALRQPSFNTTSPYNSHYHRAEDAYTTEYFDQHKSSLSDLIAEIA
jgi:hypothetical protein